DVVDVEPGELADPDAGGVEELEDGAVAQVDRVLVVRGDGGDVEDRGGSLAGEHVGQGPSALGRGQPQGRVRLETAGASGPGEEGADGSRPTREGRAGRSFRRQRAQPGPQGGEVDVAELGTTAPRTPGQAGSDVPEVGADRVLGPAPLPDQVLGEVVDAPRHPRGSG